MSDREHFTENDADTLRAVIFRMAEDITRIKQVCTQEHPPKMGSPTRDWPTGTETRHGDGSRCVLLNDGDFARVVHDCESCAACIHDGNKCCGCYDGACCQTRVVPPGERAE